MDLFLKPPKVSPEMPMKHSGRAGHGQRVNVMLSDKMIYLNLMC